MNSRFVHHHGFSSPLQRLIMVRILIAGPLSGEGERVLDNQVLEDYCCCSKQAMFKEIKNLERAGHLRVRQIGARTTEQKVRLEPARGYIIMPVQEFA
jgi:hypothetical protein